MKRAGNRSSLQSLNRQVSRQKDRFADWEKHILFCLMTTATAGADKDDMLMVHQLQRSIVMMGL
jgi:hypothetical protein